MKTIINIIIIFLIIDKTFCQENISYLDFSIEKGAFEPKFCENLNFEKNYINLAQNILIEKEPKVLTIHRYLGYTTLLASSVNGIFGYRLWDKYSNNSAPSTDSINRHKKLGYMTAGVAFTTSSFGFINFWKMKDKKIGRTKRIVHLTLSSLATAGYITAVYIARDSRISREKGTANKPFLELYSPHRKAAYLSITSTLLTVGWIIW